MYLLIAYGSFILLKILHSFQFCLIVNLLTAVNLVQKYVFWPFNTTITIITTTTTNNNNSNIYIMYSMFLLFLSVVVVGHSWAKKNNRPNQKLENIKLLMVLTSNHWSGNWQEFQKCTPETCTNIRSSVLAAESERKTWKFTYVVFLYAKIKSRSKDLNIDIKF